MAGEVILCASWGGLSGIWEWWWGGPEGELVGHGMAGRLGGCTTISHRHHHYQRRKANATAKAGCCGLNLANRAALSLPRRKWPPCDERARIRRDQPRTYVYCAVCWCWGHPEPRRVHFGGGAALPVWISVVRSVYYYCRSIILNML